MATKKMPMNPMNILEMLSKHVQRIQKFELATADQDIIVSSDHKMAVLKEDFGIKKTPITWPLYGYSMFYIVEVPAGATVPTHVHDEDVFRYVIRGSLTLNDSIQISEGQWFVVKKGVNYNVNSKTGYTALSGYKSHCRTGRGFKNEPFA